MDRVILGTVLLFLSNIPISCFIYTLIHLDQLQISITRPRVLVEVGIFLIFLFIGVKVRFVN
jgi:hypothetical protein